MTVQPRPRLRRVGRRAEQHASHAQHGRLARDRNVRSRPVVVVNIVVVVVVVIDVAQRIGFGHEHTPAVAGVVIIDVVVVVVVADGVDGISRVDGSASVGRHRHAKRNGHDVDE